MKELLLHYDLYVAAVGSRNLFVFVELDLPLAIRPHQVSRLSTLLSMKPAVQLRRGKLWTQTFGVLKDNLPFDLMLDRDV